MPNPNGTPANLIASHPGNRADAKHGIFSPAMREPRAQEIADDLMALPHVHPVDRFAAIEIGRVAALVEALDGEIERVGLDGRQTRLAWLLDMRGRYSRRLLAALGEFGATPYARAKWAREAAAGETLAESIARRRQAGVVPAPATDGALIESTARDTEQASEDGR